jgi:hypothetical protein
MTCRAFSYPGPDDVKNCHVGPQKGLTERRLCSVREEWSRELYTSAPCAQKMCTNAPFLTPHLRCVALKP